MPSANRKPRSNTEILASAAGTNAPSTYTICSKLVSLSAQSSALSHVILQTVKNAFSSRHIQRNLSCPDLSLTDSHISSYAGLTRVSIIFGTVFWKAMDCRVKPGNDDRFV